MAGKNDVAETIRQGIVDGELKPGQSIGSIDATAQKYEASVGATRLAFQELVQQATWWRADGLGTSSRTRSPTIP